METTAPSTYVLEARGPIGGAFHNIQWRVHNLVDAVGEPLQAAERGAGMQPLALPIPSPRTRSAQPS